jgi:hypothetical protein
MLLRVEMIYVLPPVRMELLLQDQKVKKSVIVGKHHPRKTLGQFQFQPHQRQYQSLQTYKTFKICNWTSSIRQCTIMLGGFEVRQNLVGKTYKPSTKPGNLVQNRYD